MSKYKLSAFSLFTEDDIYLFKAGRHYMLHERLGSHPMTVNGVKGTYFAVFAPAASQVFVMGDFNSWRSDEHQLLPRWDKSGIWEGFISDVGEGDLYKYKIKSLDEKEYFEKSDPFARFNEKPPKTASIVYKDDYHWKDQNWMANRYKKNSFSAPLSVYEVHLGSWRWKVEEQRPLSYVELADELVAYVKEMGFTHVELMPVMEHPYDPSWGYQITGFFSPTSRFGNPQEFKYLVDAFHKAEIGVILDWVPSHFPSDGHGLAHFDGSKVFEHPDTKRGYHPDWDSLIFDYGKPEVKSFLISNAIYWLDQFHADGLRVDAVASILYLDYSREYGEWDQNIYGGNENLEAIEFIKELNTAVYKFYPDIQMIAEESTAYPAVSRPIHEGGLGFGMKWMMGWMHDTLDYFSKDPIYRRFHHNSMTFAITYVFSENYMLPLSHDEVVHGKGSLLQKMPGDEWQRFANLRLLYLYMFTHPGAKLLFMGGEIAQSGEWNFAGSLDWHLLEYTFHQGTKTFVKDLNYLYRDQKALHELGFDYRGFEWIDCDDHENSVISFVRKAEDNSFLLVICNFTPVVRYDYRFGVPSAGEYEMIFNSDDQGYAGSGLHHFDALHSDEISVHQRPHSLCFNLPALGGIVLRLK
jgi:1,4-alpha-glucan branching enzyme